MQLNGHEIIALLAAVGATGVLTSVVGQGVKKTLGLKTDSVIHTMILAISAIAGYAQYVMQIHSKLPPEVLGISVSAIYGVSQIVFKYATYATNFLTNVQSDANGTPTTTTMGTPVAPTIAPASVSTSDEADF